MKKAIAAALAVAAVAVPTATAAPQRAASTSCTYKVTSMPDNSGEVSVTISGAPSLLPLMCTSFNSGMHGKRIASSHGSQIGLWRSMKYDLTLSVHATKAVYGKAFVALWAPKIEQSTALQLVRVR
jgi:hypothetical protein